MDEKPAAKVPPPPARSASADVPPPGGVKETIESILIAFVLAFVFREFVVEAFVIPTGSMAPTLMGAHVHADCPDCGYAWDINYSARAHPASGGGGGSADDDVEVPTKGIEWESSRGRRTADGQIVYDPVNLILKTHCPNCGEPIALGNESKAFPVQYGDRILVLKYAYLLGAPQRWDVVVFKTPADPRRYKYQVNYIKRLVGKPGECVMVLDGGVYVATCPAGMKWEDWEKTPDAEKTWIVQPKTRSAQDALWRLVYDNDFHPLNAHRAGGENWVQPWTVRDGKGWDTKPAGTGGKSFTFSNAAGGGKLEFDPQADPDCHYLRDWLGYDDDGAVSASQGQNPASPSVNQGQNAVSDLKLDLYYERKAGDGPLRLNLTKLGHTFTAELTPTGVRLLHTPTGGGPEGESAFVKDGELGRADLPASASAGPLHVELVNVDYQVTLRVNGNDILRTTPEQYHPNVDRLVSLYEDQSFTTPAVSIDAAAQSCRLDHVKLMRDIYYTMSLPHGPEHFSSTVRWGGPYRGATYGPVHLGKEEYFVMGDNSAASSDARYWAESIQPQLTENEGIAAQGGRVPGRFLLGKAFFVYWPAGFRPGSDDLPGLVPDFGRMRFIH